MPAFFVIAIASGVITVGSVATDAKRWMGTDRKMAEVAAFYTTTFDSAADCLTAASTVGVAASACGSENQ